MTSVLDAESIAAPTRVGVDARMLAPFPTGVGNYIAGLLLPLCSRHRETTFFLYSNSRIEIEPHPNLTVREGGMRVGPAWLNVQLPRALAADGIDVFWGANGVAPVLTTCPTVVTVHDLVYRFAGETMGRQARWTKRVFQGWSVRRAKRVAAVSKATADDVASVYGRSVDAIITPMANAAFHRQDADAVRSARERHGLPERYWLFAGTLEPRKNLVNLLEAYFRCSSDGRSMPMLVLAGARGWGDPRLLELIQDGESRGLVRRLGYVSLQDLACLYTGCEVLWMPSTYEGFGMPLLEAQACGAAVVHGLHASMVEASGGLGLATPTDVGALAEVMERVVREEAPMVCRLVERRAGDAEAAASELWRLFCSAVGSAVEGRRDT